MQYQSETNNLDLVSDIDYWAGTDDNSYPIKAKTRNANFALDKAVALIMKSDQKWEWDDTNNTDLPIATTSLVANQEDYSLAITHLEIRKIRAKDSNGNWTSPEPVDRRDLTDSELNATAATPTRYFKIGNSVFLNPKPSYASSGGLEIQFQRTASYFAYTDTTKTPGFASQFHRLISLYAARDYCAVNSINNRLKVIDNEIQKMEADVIDFYSVRNRDEKQSLRTQKSDYGEIALGTQGRSVYNQDGFNFRR